MFLFLFNSRCFDFNAIIWANACRYSFLTNLLYTFCIILFSAEIGGIAWFAFDMHVVSL